MNKKDYFNSLNYQIEDFSTLVDFQVENSFNLEKLEKILSKEKAKKLKRVVFTGCGDSYSAAGAMLDGFKKLSGIRECVVPDPMEFCRFYKKFDITLNNSEEEALVVATSVSGGGDRITEILDKGNENGVATMLVCNNVESKNVAHASIFYNMETPKDCNAPGLRCYFTMMICLLALASYIGLENGHITMDRFNEVKKEIVDYVHEYMKDYDHISDQMFEQAQRMKDLITFDAMGDNSDYWSAQFIEQKFIECGGYHANHTNSEEYVHISMMTKDPQNIGFVCIVSDQSPSLHRIAASTWGAIVCGRKTIICTDADESLFDMDRFDVRENNSKDFAFGSNTGLRATVEMPEEIIPGELVICKMAKAPEYWMSALMNYIPGTLLAGYVTAINGKMFFQNRYDWKKREFIKK